MSWSNTTWSKAQPIYDHIIGMPFITHLMDGTLSKERFEFYIAQDALYLENFSRALSQIAARVQRKDHLLDFIRFAEGAIIVEGALHHGYLKQLSPVKTMSPSCHHYCHFLMSTASQASVEVAMAAVLPCFWVYKKAGDYILAHQNKNNNPYQQWIDTYGGEEFGAIVNKAIRICDEVTETVTSQHREEMTEAFLTGCRLEWMFWDSAWNLEQWSAQ